MLDDKFRVPLLGNGTNFRATINPQVITDASRQAGKSPQLGLAATIAHEVLHHCVGQKHGHYVDEPGYVDSQVGGQIGSVLSDKSAHNIIDQLDAEEGD